MNIVVFIKQTFDTEAKIVLDGNGKIDANGVNLIINPYDEFAIEEGIRLKEKFGGEVTVVAMGGPRAQEAVRTALAMGIDKGVLVNDPEVDNTDECGRAAILAKAVAQIPYDIILAGRIAIDDGASQIAVRLAEALNVPSVSSVLKLEIAGTQATVTREIDGGTELIEVSLPAVITAQKGLNEPRYPSVAGIMKAKKKPLKTLTVADLGLSAGDLAPKMTVNEFSLPTPRKAGRVIPGDAAQAASELAKLLREEAKVL
ncbi:electron transfer flavoprotein subunit beta/FixA family protein [Desulfosporosinus sp.]|uniref:electron transfer flavoprotein subunit beta/FixA family protein n=1 Tax=Desulfosporosinus sp. TaxID=157907 RepID=UPI000E94EE9E|nr:electron transfer flavoprotein subunit beta/FixA family protein [Desulfosporosinus sp.]MBC2723382.1 electron transfer flavoprotein subunit beta/FixA family protein [Desulfosporosinus sp.]MBC2725350.1 electron transfer flavoprotein subunit beta/FixA family protein [Desulfosporosinus sp.]HBV85681.1 electron transfer flavoprotein subunit beta [Desulfosporosinus sp.]